MSEYTGPERRYQDPKGRNLVSGIVCFAKIDGIKQRARVVNLSYNGALLEFQNLFPLERNDRFEIVIALALNKGQIFRLYFKMATVTHVTNGKIGVLTGPRPKKIT